MFILRHKTRNKHALFAIGVQVLLVKHVEHVLRLVVKHVILVFTVVVELSIPLISLISAVLDTNIKQMEQLIAINQIVKMLVENGVQLLADVLIILWPLRMDRLVLALALNIIQVVQVVLVNCEVGVVQAVDVYLDTLEVGVVGLMEVRLLDGILTSTLIYV